LNGRAKASDEHNHAPPHEPGSGVLIRGESRHLLGGLPTEPVLRALVNAGCKRNAVAASLWEYPGFAEFLQVEAALPRARLSFGPQSGDSQFQNALLLRFDATKREMAGRSVAQRGKMLLDEVARLRRAGHTVDYDLDENR
jgi:hypothetical protein